MSDMAHKTTETQSAVIVSDHGGVLLRISAGGLWVNPDIPADECAQRVLASLRPILSHTIDTEVQIQVARLTAERDPAQAEVERLKNAIDHLTSERNEAQAEVERLTARQTEMETHITGLTTELHRTRADGIELRWVADEVEQLTAQRDTAQAEVERLSAERDQMATRPRGREVGRFGLDGHYLDAMEPTRPSDKTSGARLL